LSGSFVQKRKLEENKKINEVKKILS